MEITFGSAANCTTLNTHEQAVALAPERGDRVLLVLGINRVEVEHLNGSWTVTHGPNILTRAIGISDAKAFVEANTDLAALNQKA